MMNPAAEDKILNSVFGIHCPACGKWIPGKTDFKSRRIVEKSGTCYKVVCPNPTYGGKKKMMCPSLLWR